MSSTRSVMPLVVAGVCVLLAGCVYPDLEAPEPRDELLRISRTERLEGAKLRFRRPPPPVIDGEPLTVGQCIEVALDNNPRITSSWEQVRAASAAVGEARGPYWPQFEFSADAARRQSQVLTEVDAAFLRNIYGSSVTVSQLLLDGGARRRRLEAAMANRRGANLLYDSTALDVALEAEVAYYRLLAARAFREVAAEDVRKRSQHLTLAEKRQKAGLGRLIEVSQARAEKADAVLRRVEADNRVRVSRGQLAATMGLSPAMEFDIAALPETHREHQMQAAEVLLRQAARRRPRLRSALAEVTRLRRQLDAEKAERWPRLTASAEYGWQDTHLAPEERPQWLLSLGLRMPLFTGFSRTYRIARTRAQLDRAEAEYRRMFQEVSVSVWTAYSDVLKADEAIQAAETFVESARDNVRMAEEAYSAGRATIVELIDAQTTFTRARNRKVTARLEWFIAVARLERAVGETWYRDRPVWPSDTMPPPAPSDTVARRGGDRR